MNLPRIMYVCPCWPHDKSHGGQLRALQIGRALQQVGCPTLVVAGAHEVDQAVKEKTSAEFDLARPGADRLALQKEQDETGVAAVGQA